jgi:hypothetical protein
MKRTLILAVVIWLYSATFAFAIEVISPRNGHTGPKHHAVTPPGNTTYMQPTVVKQGITGTFSRIVDVRSEYAVNVSDGCWKLLRTEWKKTFTVTYSFGDFVGSSDTWSEGATTVIAEVCF